MTSCMVHIRIFVTNVIINHGLVTVQVQNDPENVDRPVISHQIAAAETELNKT